MAAIWRRGLSRAAIFLLALGAGMPFAGGAPPAAPKLSARERAALVEALPEEDRRWLTELVAPSLRPEEEAIFLELTMPEERARFREAFWARRERDGLPFPLGPGYRGRYEELRRLADSRYDGWREDAGRMVLRFGEPASIDTLDACRMTFRDLEIWTYSGGERQGTRRYFFYRRAPNAPRKLFTYGTPDSEILSPGACRKSMEALGIDCLPPDRRVMGDPCLVSACADACRVWRIYTESRTLQASTAGGESEAARMLEPFPVSTEDLAAFRKTAAPPPSSPAAAVSASASAPGRAPKLSARERAARMRGLSEDDRSWLAYVEPIILPEETNLFLSLPAGYSRDMFREDFWKRREREGLPPPLGPGYRMRFEHLLEVADSDYEGRFGDAGRMVVRRGEPSAIQELKECSEVFRQAEIWIYPPDGSTGRDVRHLFYRPSFGAPRKLWLPGDTEIFQTASCVGSFDQACARTASGAPPAATSVPCGGSQTVPRSCSAACAVSRVAEEIRSRGAAAESAAAAFAPAISTEGLDQLWQRLATSVDPNAKRIAVEGPSGAAPSAPPPEPTPALWTAEAIRDRIIALPKKYREFLDIAAPLMSDAELVAFLDAKPGDRDGFIRSFWRRHAKKG